MARSMGTPPILLLLLLSLSLTESQIEEQQTPVIQTCDVPEPGNAFHQCRFVVNEADWLTYSFVSSDLPFDVDHAPFGGALTLGPQTRGSAYQAYATCRAMGGEPAAWLHVSYYHEPEKLWRSYENRPVAPQNAAPVEGVGNTG